MKYTKEILLFFKNNFFILLPILLIGTSEILVIFFSINPFVILLLVTLSSIISLYLLYKKLLAYSSYFKSKILLVIFSIFSLTIMYLSDIYVNNYIVEFVHVKPSLFPVAQQLLFPFIGIVLWAIFVYILLLGIFLIFILKTFFDEYKANKSVIQFLGKNIRKKKDNSNSFILNISIILGISITLTVIFPLFMKFISSDYYKNEIIKKVFVFSSYYPNNKQQICINRDENDSIAFLNKDNISYINTTDNNMIFKLDKCVKKSNKTLERNSLP